MPAIRVLTALDQARTQYYHFKAIIIAGMGLFTDSYDLFCIAPVMKLIGRVYYHDPSGGGAPGVTPPAVVSATVGVALLGFVRGYLKVESAKMKDRSFNKQNMNKMGECTC